MKTFNEKESKNILEAFNVLVNEINDQAKNIEILGDIAKEQTQRNIELVKSLDEHWDKLEELENANDDLTQICFLQGEKIKNLEKKLDSL